MPDRPVVPPAPPSTADRGAGWARRQLFGSPAGTVATLALLALAAWWLPAALSWALLHAVWLPDEAACEAARGTGACWGVVAAKFRPILLGRYPFDQQWRPVAATLLIGALLAASCVPACWRRWLAVAWGAGLASFVMLMGGGVAGLASVRSDLWGGLPLTLLLSIAAIVLAFPLAVALAYGRRSRLPALRSACTAYVELVRGVPLVSVLFMASFLFPLLLPAGRSPDVLVRVVAGIALFAAAYLAETVRAGLQSVSQGQRDAAAALGLRGWQAQRLVVLPQALAAVVPALVNSFISIFKDTSLVTVVSLYELTGALGLALDGDPAWRPYRVEATLFVTAIYFAGCFALSRGALRLEGRLARGRR